jgi:SAM-dependent methyltransferase
MALDYKNIVPWGRSYEEYLDMFRLDESDLKKKILGVGDGPASFNAILSEKGGKVISVDPTYALRTEQFRKRIDETYEIVLEQVNLNRDQFVWDKIPDPAALGKIRRKAMDLFCNDFEKGKTELRYREGSLPELPFPRKAFDLVLSAHLLFLYSDHLDLEFHKRALRELVRVAKEIRIFPIVDMSNEKSSHLGPLLDLLRSAQISFSIEKTDYQFQKNGDEMLRILPGETLLA